MGGSCVVCPVFISEFAETSIRGMLGTCFQLFLTIGILFVYILGYFNCGWILLSWYCLPIPILNLIGLCFIPESPTWLLKNVCKFEQHLYVTHQLLNLNFHFENVSLASRFRGSHRN